jgi:hypothetical protein
MTKIAGSGSGSFIQSHESADPDPHLYVTDPQHCLIKIFTLTPALEDLEQEPDTDVLPGPVRAVNHARRQAVNNLLVVERHVHVRHSHSFFHIYLSSKNVKQKFWESEFRIRL